VTITPGPTEETTVLLPVTVYGGVEGATPGAP
jgi:hypothetical protein